jgi:hypothetical protein
VPLAAFCTDIPEFHGGRIFDADYAERFPGAAVFPAFAQALRDLDWNVLTGDQVHESASDLRMDEVYVVQEENSTTGQDLRARGAIPALILSGESPLYARDFYRHIGHLCGPFAHRILFTGAHAEAGHGGTNHPLLFPAFHANQQPTFIPWSGRKHLALLAGNKYWRHAAVPWTQRLQRLFRERRERDYTMWLKDNQLHDRRLDLVAHFAARRKIDVFGSGWERRGHLPSTHQQALTPLEPAGASVDYGTKQSLLAHYRFTLTMENFTYPGYVTEKIFDALAAGSIPVYLGAPDIESFVPKETFIDMRDFPTVAKLEAFLDNFDEAAATKMIGSGRHFLASTQGQQHTFEDRGRFFAELLVKVAASR